MSRQAHLHRELCAPPSTRLEVVVGEKHSLLTCLFGSHLRNESGGISSPPMVTENPDTWRRTWKYQSDVSRSRSVGVNIPPIGAPCNLASTCLSIHSWTIISHEPAVHVDRYQNLGDSCCLAPACAHPDGQGEISLIGGKSALPHTFCAVVPSQLQGHRRHLSVIWWGPAW